jgi:lysophospholipase L1-like esterase
MARIYACIGTSITEGIGTLGPDQVVSVTPWTTWAHYYAAIKNWPAIFYNHGLRGRRIKDVTLMLEDICRGRYDGVFLEIGPNDAATSALVSQHNFAVSLDEIIRTIIWTGCAPRIIVPAIPTFPQQASWIGPRSGAAVDGYNQHILAVQDVTGGMVSVVSDGLSVWEDGKLLFPDMVHPNAEGQQRLGEIFYKFVRQLR